MLRMSKDIALRIKCSKLKLGIFCAEKPGHSFSFSEILFSEQKSVWLCTAHVRMHVAERKIQISEL